MALLNGNGNGVRRESLTWLYRAVVLAVLGWAGLTADGVRQTVTRLEATIPIQLAALQKDNDDNKAAILRLWSWMTKDRGGMP